MRKRKNTKLKPMHRYLFPIVLSGVGSTPEQAWRDAIDAFTNDPGCYETAEKGDEV